MFQFNGRAYDIPGVYGIQKVIQLGGTIFPTFNVGLIIAKSMKGVPYSAYSTGLKGSQLMLAYDDSAAVARDYGYDDLYRQFVEAKKGGAGTVFLLNAQANTQVSATFNDAAGSPAASLIAKATPKNFGVFGNDIAVGFLDSASETLASGSNWSGFTGLSSGTADSGSTTTLTKSGAGWPVSAALKGLWLVITAGTGVGQSRRILGTTAPNITVDTAFSVALDATSQFKIMLPKWQVTIIPTKNEKMLTQNVTSGQNYVYLNSVDGVTVGSILGLMTNLGFIANYEVAAVDTNYTSSASGYKVVFKTAISSSDATLANYARTEESDTDNQTVVTIEYEDYKNVDSIIPILNSAQSEVTFEKAPGATLPPAKTNGNLYLGQVSGATKGVNGTLASNDFAVIAANYKTWSNEFSTTNKVDVRHICLGSGDASVHAIFKTLSTEMKDPEVKKPLVIWTGQPLGETATQLVARAKALNSDSVVVCGGGLDGRASYLSLAPQVFGNTLKNNVAHNLTRDLIDVTTLEHEWTSVELKQLTRGGVLTMMAMKTGYRIVQGINSYQDHAAEWNEQDVQTYLIQQKQCADYWFIGLMQTLDERSIGVDGINEQVLLAIANTVGIRYRDDEGVISDFRVKEVKKTALGHTVKTDVLLTGVNDFIGVVNNIITGANTL